MNWLERTELLLGKDKIQRLKQSHVLIVGLGGVGAHAAEHICRSGVGEMTIVDGDTINLSNLNRQLPALHSTLSQPKADTMAKRLYDINPELKLTVINSFIKDDEMIDILKAKPYNYVIDAIDTLSPKIFLIYHSLQNKLRIVSSMGAGGKIKPELVQMADISKTYNCKLARALRKRLNRMGIRKGVKTVFSPEEIDKKTVILTENEQNKKSTLGTISFLPALFGLYAAAEVVNDIIEGD